ncbi:MAG: hypothetical protein II901_00425, partial [Paludibacteraceae bacterium]|nr:hypothetical protein [Paludibacteraceae bacterium]
EFVISHVVLAILVHVLKLHFSSKYSDALTLRSVNTEEFYAFALSTSVALKLEVPSEALLQVSVPREGPLLTS